MSKLPISSVSHLLAGSLIKFNKEYQLIKTSINSSVLVNLQTKESTMLLYLCFFLLMYKALFFSIWIIVSVISPPHQMFRANVSGNEECAFYLLRNLKPIFSSINELGGYEMELKQTVLWTEITMLVSEPRQCRKEQHVYYFLQGTVRMFCSVQEPVSPTLKPQSTWHRSSGWDILCVLWAWLCVQLMCECVCVDK